MIWFTLSAELSGVPFGEYEQRVNTQGGVLAVLVEVYDA